MKRTIETWCRVSGTIRKLIRMTRIIRIVPLYWKLYKKEDARKQSQQVSLCTKVSRKQSRQVQLCTKVPRGRKWRFRGRSRHANNVSNMKSNLMMKSKIDYLKSQEVKNLVAMKKNSLKKNRSVSPVMKPGGFPRRMLL
ncbi:hypothetical protein L1049_022106 [Liquidambar formosana]|uniref:Uncharacterized protein n=1 Tax=Liquidambar formosana TaxID=63359 RepID=A0AAP0WNG2_LIQFO